MDDSAPPFGERRLKEIVDHVIAVGDAAESSALEAKVDVDLSEKSGRAKVVKFILGMANRTQRVVSARFGGYAVMLIGVEQESCPGISKGIEGHDLSNAFRTYFGSHTPRWDIDRVPVDGDHEVLVVIVEPPRGGDPIYFCHRSLVVPGSGGRQSELLADGALYVRDKTSTRVATGAEATELSAERGRDASLPADPDLSVVGEAICVADQHDVLNAWVQSSVEAYRTEVKDARALPVRLRKQSANPGSSLGPYSARVSPRVSDSPRRGLLLPHPAGRQKSASQTGNSALGQTGRTLLAIFSKYSRHLFSLLSSTQPTASSKALR